jgi:hypothetical protein
MRAINHGHSPSDRTTLALQEIEHAWISRPLESQFASDSDGFIDGGRRSFGEISRRSPPARSDARQR